ncbi:hypothetical protein FPV67DRAFT_237976 [Lyophyllum atratum]|nr:hypothetical protein FPV67DRAFT_237976 [Lyophyllum atratum]
MTSSVSSRSHRNTNWYDDSANLTIIQYDRKALDDPRPRVRFTPEELEDYVSKYVHYSQLAREQDDAMAHDLAAIPAAYARAMETMALEQTNKKALELYTYADIDATLDDLALKCKRTPRSLEECVQSCRFPIHTIAHLLLVCAAASYSRHTRRITSCL